MHIFNPYRNGISLRPATDPLHWWNLNNTTAGDGIDDKGTLAWGDLTANGTIATLGTSGPNGQSVVELDSGEYFDRTDVAWDSGSAENLSYSLWCKPAAGIANSARILSWRGGASNFLLQVIASTGGTNHSGALWDADDDIVIVNAGTITTSWHHLAGTWDGTSWRVYLDNAEVTGSPDTNAAVGALEQTTAMPFAIGTASWSKGITSNFVGRIGMFGIWDAALSADDISALFNSGNGLSFDGSTWS